MPKTRDPKSGTASILFFFLSALVLLFEGKLCKDAVAQGIALCLQTVIPCLFPFLLLTRWVVGTDIPNRMAYRLGRLMRQVFHCSENGAICLILGLIGGYPIGAQTVGLTYSEGRITEKEAEHLLSFCNNASPAFFFGILGSLYGSVVTSFILYSIHIISAILTGILLRPKKKPTLTRATAPSQTQKSTKNVMICSLKALGTICSYVLLFQIILHLTEHHIPLPKVASVILGGILEISTGCLSLMHLEASLLPCCLASAFLGFGGICVWLQSRSVLREVGLKGKYYLQGKAVQAVFATILTVLTAILFPDLFPTTKETLYLPNHTGLMATMLWVVGIFLLVFVIWSLILRKKTGKKDIYDV